MKKPPHVPSGDGDPVLRARELRIQLLHVVDTLEELVMELRDEVRRHVREQERPKNA